MRCVRYCGRCNMTGIRVICDLSELVTIMVTWCHHCHFIQSHSTAYPAVCRRSPMEILRITTSWQWPSEATRSTFLAKLLLLQQNVPNTECTSCSSSEPHVKMHAPSCRSRIATNCQPWQGSKENRIKTMTYPKQLMSLCSCINV